jgi:DNA-binding NarL/FixJ family response regulator
MEIDRCICVLIVHQDPLLAAGLRVILSADAEIDVVDASDIGADVVRRCGAGMSVDVIVTDYEFGLQHAKKPRAASVFDSLPEDKVMVFTSRSSEGEIHAAVRAGVRGYLLQGCSAEDAVCGVKAVARGARYLCPTALQRMADSDAHQALTGRENDVLRLLSGGLSNKLIARELGVAVGTVKAHLRAILSKLGACSRTHAVLVAAQRGLATRPPEDATASESTASGLQQRPRLLRLSHPDVGALH